MAEALTIVGEAGIHGMRYNALVDIIAGHADPRFSRRYRFSPAPPYKFSNKEFEDYMILAWRFGFVDRSGFKEVDWVSDINKSSYEVEDEIVRLTQSGWVYLEEHNKPLLHRWWATTLERVPHGMTSIATAALTTWAILYWGAPQ
tara:strand:+ start:203 stop:637 length:435 start_codon:yes stop_codon:yes gene_type:complete